MQAYTPLVKDVAGQDLTQRNLFVFTCRKPACSIDSKGWTAIRLQNNNSTTTNDSTADALTSREAAADDKAAVIGSGYDAPSTSSTADAAGDDWGLGGGAGGDDWGLGGAGRGASDWFGGDQGTAGANTIDLSDLSRQVPENQNKTSYVHKFVRRYLNNIKLPAGVLLYIVGLWTRLQLHPGPTRPRAKRIATLPQPLPLRTPRSTPAAAAR